VTITTPIASHAHGRIDARPTAAAGTPGRPAKPQRADGGFDRELTEAHGRSQPQPEEQTPLRTADEAQPADETESQQATEQTSEQPVETSETSPDGGEQEVVATPAVLMVESVQAAASTGDIVSPDGDEIHAAAPAQSTGEQATGDLTQQPHAQTNAPAEHAAPVAPLRIVATDATQGSTSNASAVTTMQAAPPAPPAPNSAAAPLPEPPVVDANVARVARGLHTALQQNGGTITLRLNPPEMGLVRVEVQVDGANVRAQLQTETDAVRTLLTQQIRHLRHALESQGLNVERLNVQTQPPASSSQQQQLGDEAHDGRSRGRHDGGGQKQTRDDQNNPRPQRGSFQQALLNLVG
jgi:flagellar hook-length control protein FliK